MKTLILIIIMLLCIDTQAQTQKYRTLNFFNVVDSTGIEQLDSFDYVRVNITVDSASATVTSMDHQTKTSTVFKVVRMECMQTYIILHLSNGEMFHYNNKMKFVQFHSKDRKQIRQYNRL